jgi:hypothetical protein
MRSSVSADLQIPLLERAIPASLVETQLERFAVASERERKLPAKFMVYLLIALCLYAPGRKSMKETLRTVLEECPTIGGRPRKAAITSPGAISKARARMGAPVMAEVYAQVVKPCATAATPGAFFKKHRVVIIDGSTLALVDWVKNFLHFGGAGKTKGLESFPMATLAVLVECGTRIIFGAALGHYKLAETTLAKELLALLGPGMLCLLDREYIGYPWLHVAKPTGADFVIRVRGNMAFPVLNVLADGSYLSHLRPPKGSRWQGQRAIRVRVIEYRITGSTDKYRLITTLLRPQDASAQELAELYHERWEVETTLREVKEYLRGGGLKTFRSQTPELVHQELYGFLLAHYCVRRAILDGAIQEDVDTDVLSFKHALSVITRKLPHMVGRLSRAQVKQCYRLLIDEVVEERVSSSRGESVERGVRRYSKYKIRGHASTTPRKKVFRVQLCPAAA